MVFAPERMLGRLAAAIVAAVATRACPSQANPIYAGPTYDAATKTGFIAIAPDNFAIVVGDGVAIGSAGRYDHSTTAIDERAFRIGTDGFSELALPVGKKVTRASAINASGII